MPEYSKQPITVTAFLFAALIAQAQHPDAAGTYTNRGVVNKMAVTLRADSTFEYKSDLHPTFFSGSEGFSETGRWRMHSDTVILNPQLAVKPFVEYDLQETGSGEDTAIQLRFYHVKRLFDGAGNVVKSDTLHIHRLDYAWNEWKKKQRVRVASSPTVRCAWAGYIPPETITDSNTITLKKPADTLKSIFIGCYELQGVKEFPVHNPGAGRLTLIVYSNYYSDGQLRQKKFLLKNEKVLYTYQKANGRFDKTDWLSDGTILKKRIP